MKRNIAGDLNETYREKLGFDVRGLVDPGPMFRIRRLIQIAERRGKKNAVQILRDLERYQYVIQSQKITSMVMEDLTKISMVGGNRDEILEENDPFDNIV